jgi:hypothetical protein
MDRDEPLDAHTARARIRTIAMEGAVSYSTHALAQRLPERAMTTADCLNVLRGGWVDGVERPDDRGWRYTVCSAQMTVVVVFRSATEIRVVTAWRNK